MVRDTDDAADTQRLIVDNRAIYQRVRTVGTLYLVGAFPMNQRDWRMHFGPVYGQLAKAKQRFDPHNMLTPGYKVFQRPTGHDR